MLDSLVTMEMEGWVDWIALLDEVKVALYSVNFQQLNTHIFLFMAFYNKDTQFVIVCYVL